MPDYKSITSIAQEIVLLSCDINACKSYFKDLCSMLSEADGYNFDKLEPYEAEYIRRSLNIFLFSGLHISDSLEKIEKTSDTLCEKLHVISKEMTVEG